MASEFELIQSIVQALPPTDAVVGPGDDAAVVALGGGLQVLTTDMLVEGVDFLRRYASPRDIGYKAAAISLSDVAAMGAHPSYMTVAIGAPVGDPELFTELTQGLRSACEPWSCSIVGGDLSRSPVLILCTTAMGKLKGRPALRSSALPGDLLLCTGSLGDAAGGLQALLSESSGHEALKERQLRPRPRVDVGWRLVEQGLVTSMLDISDGLLQDLGHLCQRSGVQATLWMEQLPISTELTHFCKEARLDPLRLALTGGEDFELLFTAPDAKLFQIQDTLKDIAPVQVIGELLSPTAGNHPKVQLLMHGLAYVPPWLALPGFDHFRSSSPHVDISVEAR